MLSLLKRPTVTGARCSDCGYAVYNAGNGQVLHVRESKQCPWINVPFGHSQPAPMPGEKWIPG